MKKLPLRKEREFCLSAIAVFFQKFHKSIQKDVGDLKVKVVEIEQSVNSAHRRLDDMQKG